MERKAWLTVFIVACFTVSFMCWIGWKSEEKRMLAEENKPLICSPVVERIFLQNRKSEVVLDNNKRIISHREAPIYQVGDTVCYRE